MRFIVQHRNKGNGHIVTGESCEEARYYAEELSQEYARVIGIATRIDEGQVCTPDLSSPYLNRDDAEQAVDRFVSYVERKTRNGS